MTKTINHSAALSNAEDEFRDEVYAMYEGVTNRSVGVDLAELETFAEITAQYVAAAEVLLSRMEYAHAGPGRYPSADLVIESFDDRLQHGAINIVKAHFARINARAEVKGVVA